MLATSGAEQIIGAVIAGLIVVVIVTIAKTGPRLLGKRQTEKRDAQSTYERLYGKAPNPRTGEPGTQGWTHHVDEGLTDLRAVTTKTSTDIGHVRRELQAMGGRILTNVERASKASAAEVIEQVTERARVQERDVTGDIEAADQATERDRVQQRDAEQDKT